MSSRETLRGKSREIVASPIVLALVFVAGVAAGQLLLETGIISKDAAKGSIPQIGRLGS